MDVYLTRHGRTQWNAQGRMQGRLDSPLLPEGRVQALALGESLRSVPFDVVYVSPSGRTLSTAGYILADREHEIPRLVDERLMEIGLGEMEGKTLDQARLLVPGMFEPPGRRETPPGGEDAFDLMARVNEFVGELVKNGDQHVLVVTHSYTLRAFHAAFFGQGRAEAIGQAPFCPPAALCHVRLVEDAWQPVVWAQGSGA